MSPEPIFPKVEGPIPPTPTAGLAVPVDDGGKPLEPPGADGFAVETNFTVSEVIDTGGETQIEVFPGDIFAEAEAASPMMFPNLSEKGFVIPTFAGSKIGPALMNIGATAWEYFFFQRFICTKTITITKVQCLVNAPAGATATSQLGFGIYNETGTSLLARTNLLHVNTDLGLAGVAEWCNFPLTSPTSLRLQAGTTYMMVQAAPGGRTNGIFVMATNTENWVTWQEATVRENGGSEAVLADRLRWGWEGIIVYAADPGLPPADLTAPLPSSCSLQNSNAWVVAP